MNPPIGLRVGPSFLLEFISVLFFVVFAFVTRDITRVVKAEAVKLRTRLRDTPRTGQHRDEPKVDSV